MKRVISYRAQLPTLNFLVDRQCSWSKFKERVCPDEIETSVLGAQILLQTLATAAKRSAILREFARANLAHLKAPHSVTFVKELPKTATGKIQKYILRGRSTAIAPQ